MCTKCGRKTRPDGTPYGDLRPQSIRAECEASMRRLGVERLDLYQIHWPDPDSGTPLEESWSAMAELVDEGKVRWIGVSNFDVDQLERCEAIRHVDSVQPQLSMIQPGALHDVIPWAAAHQTGRDRLLAHGLGAAERNLRSRPARASALRRHAPAATRIRRARPLEEPRARRAPARDRPRARLFGRRARDCMDARAGRSDRRDRRRPPARSTRRMDRRRRPGAHPELLHAIEAARAQT